VRGREHGGDAAAYTRPGRCAVIAPDLGDLHGPTAGTVELPHRFVWQGSDRIFDLGNPDLVGRGEIRDFVDMAAATARYTVTEMIDLAREVDPGLSDDDFAEAGRRLDGLKDDRFRRFGLSVDAIAEVRRRLADWPR
jgi:hypothetical protein